MKPGRRDISDREIGMNQKISRRDFIQGALGATVAGVSLGPACSPSKQEPSRGPAGLAGPPPDAAGHPPSRSGLRGSHKGAFEVAHEMALEKRTDWGRASQPDEADYDLVVVGAGVSGLSAAFFFKEAHPNARVLLLENHDDFGGHARRNEFEWQGRTILGYGGSQSIEAPSSYSDIAKGLLTRIGAETTRLADAYDQSFYRRHGLAPGIYFDRAHYGVDRVVRADLLDLSSFIPLASTGVSVRQSMDQMPLSEAAREELKNLIEGSEDLLPQHSIFREPGYLRTITYLDFLTRHLGVRNPQTLALLQDMPSNYLGHGIDVWPALDALAFGLPGLGSTSLGTFEGLFRRAIPYLVEPYIYHFPDGNASVARLLVKRLIPEVASASTMEEIVAANFDYAKLDRPESDLRLRLGSTVVRVEHEGSPSSADFVRVSYVRAGQTEQVRARRVVLACYNRVIPYLCPQLPTSQREALSSLVKVPFVYSNVLLNNWRAAEKVGVGVAHCPGSWHKFAMLDFPVSLGAYQFSPGPDEPVVVHMSSPIVQPGLPPREQSKAGRLRLLSTSFETIEREIRTHLAGMLGAGSFDPARDIEAITVNRWAHGYTFEPSPIFDPEYAPGQAPHELGRKPFGRIAIANSDAGALAYLDAAIDEAHRAVGELPS